METASGQAGRRIGFLFASVKHPPHKYLGFRFITLLTFLGGGSKYQKHLLFCLLQHA